MNNVRKWDLGSDYLLRFELWPTQQIGWVLGEKANDFLVTKGQGIPPPKWIIYDTARMFPLEW